MLLYWPKTAWLFFCNLSGKNVVEEIFVREMLTRTLSITLLQIFCKTILNLQVIVNIIKNPDDNFEGNSKVRMYQTKITNLTSDSSFSLSFFDCGQEFRYCKIPNGLHGNGRVRWWLVLFCRALCFPVRF